MPNTAAPGAAVNNINKKVKFKNFASLTSYIIEINNTKVDYAEITDIVMSVYNLIEYMDACSKTSGSLWQQYRDEPALDNNDNIIDFHANNKSNLFKIKQKITGETGNSSTKLK